MAKLTLIEAINAALAQEMERDPTVLVFGEDVGLEGGIFRATVGLQQKFGEERCFDTPLAESCIVGAAIGLAAYGFRPVPEIQFDGFTFLAMNELFNHATRIRNRSRGRFTCPLTLRSPYGGGIRALEHHSEAPESIYAHIAGLKVVVPSTPSDAKGLLASSIRDPDPVIFFEPKKIYRAFKEEVPDGDYLIPIGQGKRVREGSDVTLVSWGTMTRTCLEALDDLKTRNPQASVDFIDLRSIKPWDEALVIESVRQTGRCVIVQEAPKMSGFASEIIATINDKALDSLEAPVARVTGYDIPMPLAKNEDHYLPDAWRVRKALEKTLAY